MKTTLPKARDAARLAEKVCCCSSFIIIIIIIIYPLNVFSPHRDNQPNPQLKPPGDHIREKRHAPRLEKSLIVPPPSSPHIRHTKAIRNTRDALRRPSGRLHAHTQVRSPSGRQCAPRRARTRRRAPRPQVGNDSTRYGVGRSFF